MLILLLLLFKWRTSNKNKQIYCALIQGYIYHDRLLCEQSIRIWWSPLIFWRSGVKESKERRLYVPPWRRGCITRVTCQMWKWRTDLADMLHHIVIPGNRCWERWNEAFAILGDHVNILRCRFLLSSFYEHVCIMSLTLSFLIFLHQLPSFDLSKAVSVKTGTICLINWSQQRDLLRVRLPS